MSAGHLDASAETLKLENPVPSREQASAELGEIGSYVLHVSGLVALGTEIGARGTTPLREIAQIITHEELELAEEGAKRYALLLQQIREQGGFPPAGAIDEQPALTLVYGEE